MSTLPWTGALGRPSSSLGWASTTLHFPRSFVVATVALSRVSHQEGERFQSYTPRWAGCWIETEKTPMTRFGMHAYRQADPYKDFQVRLETDWLTFQLQSSGASSAAVATVFGFPFSPIQDLRDLVVHDVHGAVVGLHRVVVVDGATAPDDEEVVAALRARAADLDVPDAAVLRSDLDLERIPGDVGLRVDIERQQLVVERPPRHR